MPEQTEPQDVELDARIQADRHHLNIITIIQMLPKKT